MDSFCSMFSAAFNARQKAEVNFEPLFKTMSEGAPCLENTGAIDRGAKASGVRLVIDAMEMVIFASGSTTTSMELLPSNTGSSSIEFIKIDAQGRSGIGSGMSCP